MRPFRASPAAIVLIGACLGPVRAAGAPAHAYVLARGQSGVWQVDLATGNRVPIDLSDYPEVLTVSQAVVTGTGELIFSATNAAQGRAIFAANPATGSRTGVSGPIDVFGDIVRGAGPPLEPATGGLALAPWAGLYALRSFLGPMHISLVTGDRSIVSQSAPPAVGSGAPLGRPVDLAVESTGSLLVMDEYEGLVRVRLVDGARTLAFPSTLFIEPPVRFDLLPDGRIVHCVPGTDAVFVFDPRTARDEPLSGRGRGTGPAFGAVADVAVHPGGTIVALDVGDPALVSVDPATGDRSLVSGAGRGGGEALPTADDRPTLAVYTPERVAAGLPPRPVRRRLTSPQR